MSDIMKQIPFGQIMDRVFIELDKHNTVYGVKKLSYHTSGKSLDLFGTKLENPLGPAAGPHTQLAHNLVAAYVAGGRFFELKTVQTLDGTDLHIDKPCIRADDEAYNVEWSTELFVPQALEEYVKGWYAIKLIAKEFGFGNPDGFIFNMSVGYNLEGIKSKKIDDFIEGLKDASSLAVWQECEKYALDNLSKFNNVDEDFIKSINPHVCNSITLSTMHGCPANEIEDIVTHLMKEKRINTYLKCNPTLLGYDFCRSTLDKMGYDYITFDKSGFEHDLGYEDAVAMIKRLQAIGTDNKLDFGVKLSNTFHVKIANNELPGDDMYMSGKALYPLTISLAAKLAKTFEGKLPMSYSGGADKFNIKDIFETGIWPITIATVLLKPAGYNVSKELAEILDATDYPTNQIVDVAKVEALALKAVEDVKYCKTPAMREKQNNLLSFDENVKVAVHCKVTCGICADVCPNRANIVTVENGEKVLLHIDDYCNECGNCYLFCPDKCTPYKDRITLFGSVEDMKDSTNQGFAILGNGKVAYRYEGVEDECALENAPAIINAFIEGLNEQHPYLV